MIFKINPILFESLRFVPKNKFRKDDKFILVEDGILYKIDPKIDSIFYEDQEINLKDFTDALSKCNNYLKEKHPEWYGISSEQFRVSFYERNGQATAFHGMFEGKEIPKEIKMCMSYFLNLHNFKFVLAHEVGHYEEVITQKSKNSALNDFTVMLICTLLIALCSIALLVYLSQFEGKLPLTMMWFDFIFGFLSFTYYGLYVASTYCSAVSSHYAEYEADAFALRLFPECDTSYFKKSWKYSDTHPANNLRILALKKNIRVYICIIPPWFMKYCDSYKDYKATFKEMFNEIPKIPFYVFKSLKETVLAMTRKYQPLKMKESSIKNNKEGNI